MNKKLRDFKNYYIKYIEEKQLPEFYSTIKMFLNYLDNPDLIKTEYFQNVLDSYFDFLKFFSCVEFFLPYHPGDYFLSIFNTFQQSLNSSKFSFNRERYNRNASEILINENIKNIKESLIITLEYAFVITSAMPSNTFASSSALSA